MKTLTPFSPWRGRIDSEDGANGRRWHQCVHDASAYLESEMSLEKMADITGCPVIVGFACDEGVRRNKGRVGAVGGPSALRDALANSACVESFRVYDIGDINCINGDLERSQHELAEVISQLLGHKLWPIVLGGGHEVGWASFYGIHQYFAKKSMKANVGIINFDAHFDLRSVSNGPSSGTPFRQCQNYCESEGLPFNYFVLGLNPSANTEALFNFADHHGVKWVVDTAVHPGNFEHIEQHLDAYIKQLEYLYLSICLDVFNAAYAPGVSAPAALGIDPVTAIHLIKKIKRSCKYHDVELILVDIAEMNPKYDRDKQTARLGARLIYEITG